MTADSSHNWATKFSDVLNCRSTSLFGKQVERHESGLPEFDPFDWLRDTVNSELQRHQWIQKDTGNPVEIWFDFASHSDINACAFRDKDLYFISVNHIVLSGMTQLISEVLRRTDIFPKHGKPERLEKATRESPIELPSAAAPNEHAILAAKAGIATVLPSDPARFQLCLFASRICLDLLYFHELNHILLGHVRHCEHRFGPTVLFEAPTNGTECVATTKEFEYVADRVAGTALARCLLSRKFTISGEVEEETDEKKDQLDRELTSVVLFAVGMFFASIESQLLRDEIAGMPQYPYSETRWMSVLRGFEIEFEEQDHPLVDDVFTSVFEDALRNIMIAVTESGYRDSLFGPAFVDRDRRSRACDQLVLLDEAFGETIEATRDFGVEPASLRQS